MKYHIRIIYLALLILNHIQVVAREIVENPVIEGWYADPEGVVLDNKYWIYPTLSLLYGEDVSKYHEDANRVIDAVNQDYRIQTHFDAFSSPDLVNWTKHPEVLSIRNVSWAKFALWAPSIIKSNDFYY